MTSHFIHKKIKLDYFDPQISILLCTEIVVLILVLEIFYKIMLRITKSVLYNC